MTLSSNSPAWNNARIKNHDDKALLARLDQYFNAFVTADSQGLDDIMADDYHMTDIPLGVARCPKKAWLLQNSGFSGLLTNLSVEAISLYGSSEPGSFSVMEHVVWFTLKDDPPEAAKPNLPPGAKKGDSSGMINISLMWWNSEGKITRELEYGRILWDGFDVGAF
ncbi:hypothetical protein N7456_010555 [Penicillium angulare]|uniref:SnoaL-like domain-containing protein n=1 Tax=Penicillium angulare TaxID=116970 RepID=A0A9W9K6B4_9EURO|nr:hypothetical protein N7456_010555 [Penicillium angulare]